MAEYDPRNPSTWTPGDAVDAREIARRVSVIRARDLSASYVQRNLSRQSDFPDSIPWEINGGRAWWWGAVLKWFRATGRTRKDAPRSSVVERP